MNKKSIILGAGMTGLAAGFASGLPVFEAADTPGGICSSYYIHPGEKERLAGPPIHEKAYRFEVGGGHWIFGADPNILHFIQNLTPVKTYTRQSSVYFRKNNLYVPYPLQNHLRVLGRKISEKTLSEIAGNGGTPRTMKEWLRQSFGPTLCDLFFYPFHELYTAGLYDRIAPQDGYKSPVDLSLVIQGASTNTSSVGYNATFIYPEKGLNALSQRMADRCNIHFGKQVVKIDVHNKEVRFTDGSALVYDSLISTLPLNKMMQMTGLSVKDDPDPYTSVLVLNIGAERGGHCPDDQWIYTPDAVSGFHRIGFYSNVDRSFLPVSSQRENSKVGIYVEKAYRGGDKPLDDEIRTYVDNVTQELQEWGFIGDIEVADPTWIDVAYTWSWTDSHWKQRALAKLENHNIYPVGRYARWTFQGIAESLRDGLSILSLIT